MNSDPKDDGTGLAFGGKTEIATLVMTLRPDEAPLGELSLVDWRWLETAMTHLTQIDQSRRAVNVCDNAYCTFDVGLAYFQFLAPPFGSYLRCEMVSEKCVPEIAEILTPEKRDRLVHEFGFSSSTKNFEQRIAINGDEDLAYVTRMAFRVLKDIYEVKDFGTAKFKLSMPKPALPFAQAFALPISPAMVPAAEKPYVVLVDDNFHYQKGGGAVQGRGLCNARGGREQVREHRRRFPQEWTQAWNVVEGTLRAVLYVWRRPFYPRARGRLFRMGLRTAAL